MKKMGLALVSLYLAVIIMANLYVNFALEKQVNKRREYFSTEWAFTLFPGVFYARNLKFYIYSKKFSLENTVSNSMIIISPLALLEKKVEIKKAYGTKLHSFLRRPLPPLERKKKPVWEYNLRNVTLSDLYGDFRKYDFLGPEDELRFSILIHPQEIVIEEFDWAFKESSLKGVLNKINGNFTANYSGQKTVPDLLDNVNIDSAIKFNLESLPGLNQFAKKHKLKFTTTSARIDSRFKVTKGKINDESFLEVENFKGGGELAKTAVQSQGALSWRQRTKELNISLAPFKVMNEKEELLLLASSLRIKLKSEATYLREFLQYSRVEINFPDFKIPNTQNWAKLYSKTLPISGELEGAIKVVMDAKRKKSIDLSLYFDDLKYKKTPIKGVVIAEGSFSPQGKEQNGNILISASLNPKVDKALIQTKDDLKMGIKVSNIVVKENKTFSATIDAELNDNAPLINLIFDHTHKGKIKLHFIRAYETDLHFRMVYGPEEIKLQGIKAKLKASRRFDGDLVYDKKTKKVNGKGKIKVYGLLTPVDIKDNKIKR